MRTSAVKGERLASRGLGVAPSGLTTWRLPSGTAYVLVEPDAGRGPVHVAVVTEGEGLSGLPLTTVPTTVREPVVRMRTE